MPNRTIKDSICTSDSINQLTAEEERFFTRLIVNCDDYGRMEARPEVVRAKCFPLKMDQIKIEDIEKWLAKLADESIGTIMIYENKGKLYLQFINWEEHNTPRASKSKYPSPYDNESEIKTIECNCNQLPEIVSVHAENLAHTYIRNTKDRRSKDPKDRRSNAEGKNKKQYADYVTMTEDEYNRLTEKFGDKTTQLLITELDNYKGASPKKRKYESDYRAILSWVVEKVLKKYNIKQPKAQETLKEWVDDG